MITHAVRIPDENLRFRTVPVGTLREDSIFTMIQNGHLTQAQFVHWLEAERDRWLTFGHATCPCANVKEHEIGGYEPNESVAIELF